MRFIWPLLLLTLAGCSSSGPIRAPAELEPITGAADVNRAVKVVWHRSTSSSKLNMVYDRLQPAIADGRLYSANANGMVYAVDLANGDKQWQREFDLVISSGVGVNEELLFVATSKAVVLALSRNDGAEQWRATLSSEVLAPPVASSSQVIVRCVDGNVYALNSESGQQLWRYQGSVPALSLRGDGTPVIEGDNVLLGLANGRIVALSLYDGSVTWESNVAVAQGRTDLERMVDVDAPPLVADDTLYAVAHQGRVVALSRLTGAQLWSHEIGSSAGMALDEHHLYVVDDEDNLWALDRNNGASLWKSDKLKYRDLTAPAAVKDAVVVGDFEGYLHWLSLEDGHLIARHQVDSDGIRAAPIVINNVLYVRSKNGDLEALTLVP
jgi:outer membrane protein assembly factor BamB